MRDTGIGRKTRRSSSDKRVSLKVPKGWDDLSQDQLRQTLEMYTLLGGRGTESVKAALLCSFNGITVHRKSQDGWVCEREGKAFVLAEGLLPDIFAHMDWIDHPERMTVRLETVSGYSATDMWLRKLPFGGYLMLENFYQAFLQSESEDLLMKMARVLYRVPEKEKPPFAPQAYELNAVFLWYCSVKERFAREFPHFLKPAGRQQETGTQASQKEIMTAQIRLLTKGDVTKNNDILERTDTWSALTELDALAQDAEDFNRKMKKNK